MARILLIGSDDGLRVAGILRAAGHEVALAATGKEGLSAARHSLSDAAVLDMSTPDMDGLTVLAALKHGRKTRRLPVVALVESDVESARSSSFLRHADAHLSKPVGQLALLGAVGHVLSERARAEGGATLPAQAVTPP